MKALISALSVLVAPVLLGAETPKVLDFLPQESYVKGGVLAVVPPAELDKYVAIVEQAAAKNPEWFTEQAAKHAPGVPLPFHENLGLSKEQYDEYLALWEKREFKAVEGVILQLKQTRDKKWAIRVASAAQGGGASPISTLQYDQEKDVFVSPNGTLARLEDVSADKHSILGEWTGHEWRFEEETSLGKTKENFAIGKTGDGKFGMLVYRMQEISSEGTPIYDKSMVIRFPMGKAGILTPEQLQGGR